MEMRWYQMKMLMKIEEQTDTPDTRISERNRIEERRSKIRTDTGFQHVKV